MINCNFRPLYLNVPGFVASLLCLLSVFPAPARAVVVDDLYEVTIPVPDESKGIRRAALADGLGEVLVRVSGDSGILQKLNPPSAGAYVKQFRYINGGAGPAKTEAAVLQLWVQYNATRILKLLREQAIPIWSEHRSEAVVWLAVRDGVNQYILKNQDVSLLKDSVDASFKRRGIPVIWPDNDAGDQQQLSFADIWAGFASPLQQASRRYSAGPVVAASLTWNGRSWLADWSVFAGRESWRWNYEDSDYTALIAYAVDRLADAMGETYAVIEKLDSATLEQVMVEIDDVDTVGSFRRIHDYLSKLSAVQSIHLTQVEPQRITFQIKLRSDIDDLLNLIKSDKKLNPLVNADAAALPADHVVYRFRINN